MELLNFRIMKETIVIIILMLTFSSCWPGFILFDTKKEAKQETTVKYSNNDMNIEKLINTNGFYIKKDNFPLIPENDSTFRYCVMFLTDGTMITFYLDNKGGYHTECDIKNNLYKYINTRKIRIFNRGIYKVVNDTIYANSFFLNQYFWCVVKHKYKIEGYERLMFLDIVNGKQKCIDEYVFFPIEEQTEMLDMRYVNRPLKRHKWLWESEGDWNKWKKKRK